MKLLKSRIKYYLLDWMDRNMDRYVEMFRERGINDLTDREIMKLFDRVVSEDRENIFSHDNAMESSLFS